ncbi:hypothetical protein GTA08_BOTSDO02493 [Neofusicoccum parvum]|nr:hypothetical protein GTA08_BOTSDO02493 [Neofusicoccum parvum]
MTATLSLAQTTTQSPSSSVMDDDDDDDSAPLLPHEITSNTPPPVQIPQIKRLSLVSSHHAPALVSPAAPPALLRRPQSPLEPFPAFDPTIGPPPSPPRPPPPQPATPTYPAPPAPHLQEKRRTIIRDPRPQDQQQPPAPPLSRDDFLPAMIRCHTLFSLAERQAAAGGSAHAQARARLGEAAALLAALERAPAAGPQMIELSTASLRARLRALEGRVAAREEEGEELCEGTARATAWLGEL